MLVLFLQAIVCTRKCLLSLSQPVALIPERFLQILLLFHSSFGSIIEDIIAMLRSLLASSRISLVHGIPSHIRIHIHVICVEDRIRLQEPSELRVVHPRFVVIEPKLG